MWMNSLLVLLGVLGIFAPQLALIGTFVLALIATLRPGVFEKAVRSMWAVQVEPAATDLLFGLSLVQGAVKTRFSIPVNLFGLGLLLFWSANLMAIYLGAVDLGVAAKFGLVSIYLMALPYLMCNLIKDGKQLEGMLNAFRFSALLAAGIIVLSFLAVQLHLHPSADVFTAGRPKGLFKDPNVAAPFVGAAFLYGMSRWMVGHERLSVKLVAELTTLLIAVMLVFSRGALVNTVIGLGIVFLCSAVSARALLRWLLVGMFVIPVAVQGFLNLAQQTGQTSRLNVANDYDKYGRLMAWRAGLNTLQEHPLGVGPGQYEAYSVAYQLRVGNIQYLTASAHNTYLRVAVENGVFGLLAYAVMLAWALATAARNWWWYRRQRLLQAAAISAFSLAALVGIVCEGVIVDTLHWRHLWLIIGVAATQQVLRSAGVSARRSFLPPRPAALQRELL